MSASMESMHIAVAALKVATADHYLVTLKPGLLREHLDDAVQLLIDTETGNGPTRFRGGFWSPATLERAYEVLYAAGAARR